MPDTFDVRAPAEQTEGTRSQVLRWLKSVGDTVGENEPLLELETDKVTVEVASPASGVLREILKREQEEIEPGGLLGRIELGSGLAGISRGAPTPAPASGRSAQRAAVEKSGAAGLLSPAVRRLLQQHGLEPHAIRGSGEGGRVTVDDVLAHVGQRPAAATADIETPGVRRVTHSAVRRRIAEHMVESLLHTAPHVTSVFEVDLSAVLAHRTRMQQQFANRGVPLTLTAYFVAAAVPAIRAVPEANSRWTDNALELYETINVGIATALENGDLVVPVLADVGSRDLFGIAQGLNELVSRARAGKLQTADMRGGTFTISNHGVSGSLLAAPIIINQPQAAILGIGKLVKRPVVLEEEGAERIVARSMCYVTLTIDHRVMDGYQANRFLQTFTAALSGWPAQ